MRISDWSSDVFSSDLVAKAVLQEIGRFRQSGDGYAAGLAFSRELRHPRRFRCFQMRAKGDAVPRHACMHRRDVAAENTTVEDEGRGDRKSTRLNSSH